MNASRTETNPRVQYLVDRQKIVLIDCRELLIQHYSRNQGSDFRQKLDKLVLPASGRNLIHSPFFRQKPQPHTRASFFRQKPHKLSLPSSGRNLIFSPFRFPVEISCTLPSDRNLINSPFRFPVETSYTLPSFFRQKPYILSILVTDRKLMNMSRIS